MSNGSNFLKQFANEEQDPKVVEQVHSSVQPILTSGEEIRYIAVQKRPLVIMTPDSIILTTKRFILYKPKLTGGVDFEDYIWRDLQDVRLKEGMLGATLTWQLTSGKVCSMDYLPKAQARRLYAVAQEMEERVREERRARDLEDKRAAAGGVIVQNPLVTSPSAPAPVDPFETLKKLKAMVDAGLITQAEYDAKKAEVLSSM